MKLLKGEYRVTHGFANTIPFSIASRRHVFPSGENQR
jgi:hypothetical protein